jgi:dihydroflavonol-4-reductase
MKTVVTGANGFIGSAVVRRLLARGREVRCCVEPGVPTRNLDGLDVEIVEAEINDRDAVGRALRGADTLYHLAAIYKLWLPDYRLMYEVNVEGTKTALFAALKAGLRRVVYTSSIAAIGQPGNGQLADESCEFNLWDEANHYVRSKWLSERDALRFAAEGLPVVVVNPAFPFGERDIGPTPTGSFVVETLKQKVPGYVEGGFNAVDVEDVAEAHVLAEEKGVVGERYILGNHNLTYKEFYDVVAEIGGVRPVTRKLPGRAILGVAWLMEKAALLRGQEPKVTYDTARYAARKLWYDTTKAHTQLGMPRTPLRESVSKAIQWFRANGYA